MHKHDVKRGGVGAFSFLILLLISILLTYKAYAFGVSTPYLENDTLKLLPGQNYTYALTLQNGDDRDLYVDIIYSSTKNIATLNSRTYYIPAKTYNNTFYFNINMPTDAIIGEKYILEYSTKQRLENNGSVSFGVEIKRSITIIAEDEKNTNMNPTVSSISTQKDSQKEANNIDKIVDSIVNNDVLKKTWKFGVAILIMLLVILVIVRVWKMSRGITSKLSHKHKASHTTISHAASLGEIKHLLSLISDEEYELPEIRNIFKNKLSELTNNELVEHLPHISRQEALVALDQILK